jgi:hypothetical protein
MDEPVEFNSGHYAELLDRVHIASSYLQMAIEDHPVLRKHPELNVLYNEAVDRLESLYSAIGQFDEAWT